jgi:glycosyltransferase involved in cell wall biosynthesis
MTAPGGTKADLRSRATLRSNIAEGSTESRSERALSVQGRKPDRLSVLLVYDCIYPDSIGGVEHRNHQIAEQLAKRGHRAVLAGWRDSAGRNTQPILDMRLRTKIYSASGKRSPIASLRFAAACLFLPIRQFDVIETANIPYMHIIPLAIRCRLAGKPLVITWHEYWGAYWRSYVGPTRAPVFAAMEWLTAQLGSAVSAVSSLTANRLRAHRRGGRDVPIVPCGIALDRIRSATAGTKRERSTLVYAGRLMPEKRLDLAIDALRHTTRSRPILKIIGDGPDRPRLEALVRELRLNDRVRFIGRLASPDEVWREIACARVAVQPSSREGFGMFPLEALACGTPVICCESAESAVPDLIGDGERGYCAPATPASLAETIDTIMESDDMWERMSMNAIRFAEAYRWEMIGERMELLFSTVLDGGRPAA